MKNKILKIAIIVIILVTFVDQTSKILVTKFLTEKIGNNFFALEKVINTGMAFGFNDGNSKNIFLTLFVILIIISFMKNQRDEIDNKTAIAVSLVLGGGISNLIDRLFRGGILDFIKISIIPNFNIADLCICIGWVLLIVFLVIYTRQTDIIKEEK